MIGVLVLGMVVLFNNEKLVAATKQKASARYAAPLPPPTSSIAQLRFTASLMTERMQHSRLLRSVVAASIAGIQALPDAINALLLVFTISAANSDIYLASRTLWALAGRMARPRRSSTELTSVACRCPPSRCRPSSSPWAS